MKKFFAPALIVAALLFGASAAQAQQVGVNNPTPDASAVLDVKSTTQGMLIPRMTAAQRQAIAAPATGLMVYQISGTEGFYFFDGAAWTALSGSGATGPQGPIGPQGPAGNDGANGATGATGPQGPIGLTGATGTAGATGAQGPIGLTGPAGATGAQGPIGLTGAAGAAGAAGTPGAQGIQGIQGPAGTNGTPGATGATGPAGPGVPTGGTAGQVLSKVDGTNFNTTWTTPAAGGADTYPSIQLSTSVTSAQNIPPLANSNTFVPLVFSSSNGTGAALTGGNTWNGTTFTVGSAGTGTYQVTVHMMPAPPSNLGVYYFLDKNNAVGNTTSTTSPYALSTYNLNSSGGNFRFNSTISTVIYLVAGDQLTLRGQSISTSITSNTNPDGSNNLQIVRLR